MSAVGVVCALGRPVQTRSYVSASGVTEMNTYRPLKDQRPIIARIENERVASYSY